MHLNLPKPYLSGAQRTLTQFRCPLVPSLQVHPRCYPVLQTRRATDCFTHRPWCSAGFCDCGGGRL